MTNPSLGTWSFEHTICNYTMPGGICGKPAFVHVIWHGRVHSSSCEEHSGLLAGKRYLQVHPFRAGCGNPRSLWFESQETCHVPCILEGFVGGVFLVD